MSSIATLSKELSKYGNPLEVASSCIRGLIVPDSGNDFIGIDYAAIEARITAWLASEEKNLDIFRRGEDAYVAAASDIYGVPKSEVTKDQRQVGKVAVLALGFGGGKGAFQQMAKGYGVRVTDKQAEEIKTAWRNKNSKIVKMWSSLEQAAVKAVESGKSHACHKISYKKSGSFLLCTLPSGRDIVYPYPKVELDTSWYTPRKKLTAMGVDSVTKKWCRRDIWYGILVENIVQAIARDILVAALLYLDDDGYDIVAHIHDEVLLEVPQDLLSVDYIIIQIKNAIPEWAEGLPIECEGWRGKRYQK